MAPMFIVNPLAAAGSVSNIFSTHPATEDRIRVLRSLGQDASMAAYEAAYRQVHEGHGVIGSRSLQNATPAAVVYWRGTAAARSTCATMARRAKRIAAGA